MSHTIVLLGGPADLTRMAHPGNSGDIFVPAVQARPTMARWTEADLKHTFVEHRYQRFCSLPNGDLVFFWAGVA